MTKPFRLVIEGRADDIFIPNLIENAMKLMGHGGTLRFDFGPTALEED